MSLRTRSGKLPAVPKPRQNLMENPNFRTTSGTLEIRRNLCPNPSFEVDTVWWSVGGSGGVGSRDTLTYSHGTASFKIVRQNAATASVSVNTTNMAVSPGDVVSISWRYKTTSASTTIGILHWRDAGNAIITQPSITVPSNATASDWVDLQMVNLVAPAGTVSCVFIPVYLPSGAGADGDSHWIDSVLVEKSSVVLPYFDGSTAAAGGLTYSWTGTANASASIATGSRPAGITNGVAYLRPGVGMVVPAFKATNPDTYVSLNGDVGGVYAPLVAGKTFTASATASASAADPSEDAGRSRGITIYYKTPSTGYQSVSSAKAPIGSEARISVTATIPPDASEAFIRFYNGSSGQKREVTFRNVLIEEGATAGNFFEGTSIETATHNYRWAGSPNASVSEEVKKYPLSILDIDGVTWRTMKNIVPRTNVAYNPRGAGVAGTVNVRTNLCTNPNLETNANNWGVMGSATGTRLTTGGYVGPARYQAVTTGAASFEGIAVTGMLTSAFQPYAGRIALRVESGTASVYVYVRINYTDATLTDSAYVAQTVTTQWQEFTTPVVTPTAGKTVANVHLFARTSSAQAITLYGDAALVEISSVTAGPYFDGNTTNKALNPGAEVNTASVGSMGNQGVTVTRDTTVKRSGSASFKVVRNGDSSGIKWYVTNGELQPGATYTISMYVYTDTAGVTITRYGEGSRFPEGTYLSIISSSVEANTIAITPGTWNRVSWTVTLSTVLDPAMTAGLGWLFAGVGSGTTVWVDDVHISNNPFGEDFTYIWTGTTNAATSIQRAPQAIGWGVTSKNNTGPDSVTYRRANGQIRHLTRPGSYSWNVCTTALNTTGIKPGQPLTFLFKASVGGGWAQSAFTKAYTIVETNAMNGIGVNTPNFSATSTPTEFRLKAVATADPADNAVLYLGTGGASSESWMDFDYMLLILEDYDGAFFDGDMPADPDYTYSWNGTPNGTGGLSIATPS